MKLAVVGKKFGPTNEVIPVTTLPVIALLDNISTEGTILEGVIDKIPFELTSVPEPIVKMVALLF